jgi:ABC-type transport system involved in multi-copper enzyme maturation permease subunit
MIKISFFSGYDKTWLLFKDELNGFAKSSVMIGMWVGMPLMGLLLYFILPDAMPVNGPGLSEANISIPASTFLALMLSSTAGLLAATLVGIDIVNEKNKKIYDLFLIRPINRGSYMWAKFFAVSLCVTVAFAISMGAGILVDVIRGVEISPMMRETILEKFFSGVGVVAISTASGILIGMMSSSVLMAVMLVWFIGQNLMFIPILATVISNTWVMAITMGLTAVLSILFVFVASMIFKRMET